ncbi:MAG: dTDP-4-dehydrorhamnose 3,5-epimerase [Anaerolineales bacterium]
MVFSATGLPGVFVIDPEPHADSRGFFARTFCQNEFAGHGINFSVAQCNISSNTVKGTLRGMHYQSEPFAEAKLVRCTMGALYDVVVDLRPGSPAFRQWLGMELTAQNRRALYIPEGLAHGFQTLVDDTEVLYQMSEFYHPECARGVRWDDSAFKIEWPIKNPLISDRDRGFSDFAGKA